MPIPVGRIIDRERSRTSSSNWVFPENIGPHGMLLMFKEYNFNSTRSTRNFSFSNPNRSDGNQIVGDSILLPLPRNLIDNYSIEVRSNQMGFMGEEYAKSISSATNGENLANVIPSVLDSIKKSLPTGSEFYNALKGLATEGGTNNSDAASKLSFLGRRLLDNLPANVGRSVDAGIGSIINPKAALTFDGVVLKNHTFDWELAPKSRSESENLKNVITVLKKNSLPAYIDILSNSEGSTLFSRGLLKYPSLVDIFLLGVDPSHYIYYKTSMITQINISYTPQSGHVIMAGGKPGIVTLTLSLLETDIHTSEDYGGSSAGGENFDEFSTPIGEADNR